MWCHYFSPDTFWDQTAATFAASLRGRIKALQHQAEQDTVLAWKTANFVGAAWAGKLKDLDHYIAKRPIRAQTADEVAAIFKTLKAKGRSVTIRKRPKGQLLQ